MEPADVAMPALFSGELEAVPLAQTLAALEARQASGALRVFGVALRGEIIVCGSRVLDATTNLRRGQDAALRLLWLRRGRFEFHPRPQARVGADAGWSIAALLRDAGAILAELQRLGSRAPGLADRVEITDPATARAAFPESAAWAARLAAGRPPVGIGELAIELGVSTYGCRAALGRAAETGALHILPGLR